MAAGADWRRSTTSDAGMKTVTPRSLESTETNHTSNRSGPLKRFLDAGIELVRGMQRDGLGAWKLAALGRSVMRRHTAEQ